MSMEPGGMRIYVTTRDQLVKIVKWQNVLLMKEFQFYKRTHIGLGKVSPVKIILYSHLFSHCPAVITSSP